MNNETQNVATDATLDAELNELIGDATAGTTPVAAVAANDDIDLAEIDAAANTETMKREAYAEQEADTAGDTGGATVTPITAAKAPKTPRAPRVSRAAGAKASDVLKSAMSGEQLAKAAMLLTADQEDPQLVIALQDTVDKLAKKVGDKAVNLLRNISEPKKLQNYTRLGLERLVATGSLSSVDLTKHLQSAGYTIGTARSQANQIMALFPALKIADKGGRTLTLNADSALVKSYRDAIAA